MALQGVMTSFMLSLASDTVVTGMGFLTAHMLDLIARHMICGHLRPVKSVLLVSPALTVIHLLSTHCSFNIAYLNQSITFFNSGAMMAT